MRHKPKVAKSHERASSFLLSSLQEVQQNEGRYCAFFASSSILTAILSFDLYVVFRWLNARDALTFIGFGDGSRAERILRLFVTVLGPGYIIFRVIIREEFLRGMRYDDSALKKGRAALLVFVGVTFVAVLLTRILLGSLTQR